MKKSIKETPKTKSSSNKKSARPVAAKQKGYKEEVYDKEAQEDYDKSELADKSKKNTSGPDY